MTAPLRHAFIGLVCAVLLASCSKGNEGPGYVPPETAEQTHLMYMPWSDNLTSYFRINIDDMARVVAAGIDDDVRVLVFFMESATSGSLFEMYRQKGECVRRTIKSYTAPIDFTSAAGIASILGDVKAEALTQAGLYMDYILFDDCYMSSVEVAYDLRHVTDYLIGSTSEIMAYGFPYALAGEYMLGEVDYEGICNAFHGFYSTYEYPYGTIGVTCCAELDDLADVMRRINSACTFDTSRVDELQRLDGYSPALFFDMGDYVRHLCTDTALLDEFERQLARTVPWHRHTDYYYSMTNGKNPIHTFSGITTSDPSIDPEIMIDRQQTAWYQATH